MLSPSVRSSIGRLDPRGPGIRCNELVRLLEALGFVVRRGRKGNHRSVEHPYLPGFRGTNFDCGHGRDPQVRRVYIRSLRRVIETHAEALSELA
jgi:hypothetical protein